MSGGQSGADRAAVDVALAVGLRYSGWVPRGGWAEDLPDPPGVLGRYPGLREADSDDPDVRTARNVRDAGATLLFLPEGVASPGTELTARCALAIGQPTCTVDPFARGAVATVRRFVAGLPAGTAINVAGPRASERTGIYGAVRDVLLACADVLLGDRSGEGR